MGNCFSFHRRSHQRMRNDDDLYDETTSSAPRREKIYDRIFRWLSEKLASHRPNPYANLVQSDTTDREIYNPIVDGRELWPHETPDIWAVPAEERVTPKFSSNNNLSDNSKQIHSDSQSSVDLEWENDEALPSKPLESSPRRFSIENHERMSITSAVSQRSRRSSLSNDLEWDEDFPENYTFSSVKVDFDTEQLIAEIDKMTEKALRETEREDTSLPPFESMDSMPSL